MSADRPGLLHRPPGPGCEKWCRSLRFLVFFLFFFLGRTPPTDFAGTTSTPLFPPSHSPLHRAQLPGQRERRCVPVEESCVPALSGIGGATTTTTRTTRPTARGSSAACSWMGNETECHIPRFRPMVWGQSVSNHKFIALKLCAWRATWQGTAPRGLRLRLN